MPKVRKKIILLFCKEGEENIVDDEKCNDDIEEEKVILDEGEEINNDKEGSGMIDIFYTDQNQINIQFILTVSKH